MKKDMNMQNTFLYFFVTGHINVWIVLFYYLCVINNFNNKDFYL